tara:strand:+ start:302 stop:1081 length:780 start_codon:yes stop_codon:yes gene_type:complete
MTNNILENTKGIILAGGAGTRLMPLTKITSKQLLPIYNRPMIYYPLSVLINSGIKEILIITTPEDQVNFKKLLSTGEEFGVTIDYEIQNNPEGIAQTFIISEDWINHSNVTLILGDNLFFGPNISNLINDCIRSNEGATIFGYEVDDPERFGVVEFNDSNDVIKIEEKPKAPKSNWAVTGLYIYDSHVCEYSKLLTKSDRGELEITDLNNKYIDQNQMRVQLLNKDYSWLDTGTFDSLFEASDYVRNFEKKHKREIIKF